MGDKPPPYGPRCVAVEVEVEVGVGVATAAYFARGCALSYTSASRFQSRCV